MRRKSQFHLSMQDSFADAASDQEKKASYFMVPRAKINEPGAPKVTVIRSYGSQRVVFLAGQ